MRKRIAILMTAATLGLTVLAGCGGQQNKTQAEASKATGSQTTEAESSGVTSDADLVDESAPTDNTAAALEDGVYSAEFDTDSSMFHVNEACDGVGRLTVKDGQMTIHISLPSKKIVNLYAGLAEDAKKDGAQLLEPTTDTVTYEDGTTEEVYGFDVPVPALGEEFDLALIGTKGTWYDHKVSVSNPVPLED